MTKNRNFSDDGEKQRNVQVVLLGRDAGRLALVNVHSPLDRFCAYKITERVHRAARNGITDVILDLTHCPEVSRLGVAELTIRTRADSLNPILSYWPCGRRFDQIFAKYRWREADLPTLLDRATKSLATDTQEAGKGESDREMPLEFVPTNPDE